MAGTRRELQALCELLRALADATRLRILAELDGGPLSVKELCRRLRVSQPTVSHHLGILRLHGFVSARRNGKEMHYSLRTAPLAAVAKTGRRLTGRPAVQIGPLVMALRKG